jgi:hypothetical protein
MRYTARDGGAQLKAQADQELQTALNDFIRVEGKRGLAQMFSLRHEFSTEWSRFLNVASGTIQSLTMAMTKDRFPLLFQGKIITINSMEVYVKVKHDADHIGSRPNCAAATRDRSNIAVGSMEWIDPRDEGEPQQLARRVHSQCVAQQRTAFGSKCDSGRDRGLPLQRGVKMQAADFLRSASTGSL